MRSSTAVARKVCVPPPDDPVIADARCIDIFTAAEPVDHANRVPRLQNGGLGNAMGELRRFPPADHVPRQCNGAHAGEVCAESLVVVLETTLGVVILPTKMPMRTEHRRVRSLATDRFIQVGRDEQARCRFNLKVQHAVVIEGMLTGHVDTNGHTFCINFKSQRIQEMSADVPGPLVPGRCIRPGCPAAGQVLGCESLVNHMVGGPPICRRRGLFLQGEDHGKAGKQKLHGWYSCLDGSVHPPVAVCRAFNGSLPTYPLDSTTLIGNDGWMARLLTTLLLGCFMLHTPVWAGEVESALDRAGENRGQIQQALAEVPADQRPGMEWLLAHMPEEDLRTLDATFLLENCQHAYAAWREAPWHEEVSEEMFFEAILPYASINERRDNWRADFRERFAQQVTEATSPSEAAAILNNAMYEQVGVIYSTKRPKADQSPYESIDAGMASCTGLTVPADRCLPVAGHPCSIRRDATLV